MSVSQGHYDLSVDLKGYATKAGVKAALSTIGAQVLRISVGRWEVGTILTTAQQAEREYFRGRTLTDAQNPAKYNLDYLDRQLREVNSLGLRPLICVDMMPATLSSGHYITPPPGHQYVNGVRTAPPKDYAVFAEVVAFLVRRYQSYNPIWEVWNEPDLRGIDPTIAPFWTGSFQQLATLYLSIAKRVKSEFPSVPLGGCSFAAPQVWLPSFLSVVKQMGSPLDFLSYHIYQADPALFGTIPQAVAGAMSQIGVPVPQIVAEWCGDLNATADWFGGTAHYEHHRQALANMQAAGVTLSTHALLYDMSPQAGPAIMTQAGGIKPVYQAFAEVQGQAKRWANIVVPVMTLGLAFLLMATSLR